MKLEELLNYVQPTEYIVTTENYSDRFETPVLTAGKTFVLGKTNEREGIYPASKQEPVILFDDFTTASQWVDFPFKVKSSACKILTPKKDVNLKYVYYAMKSIRFNASQHMRYWISKYSKKEIRYPDSHKQVLIVESLDKITNEIKNENRLLSMLDSLIKSRFNEIFGDPTINEYKYPTVSLSKLTPFNSIKNIVTKNDNTWLLNLDMIEPNTGIVLSKLRTSSLDGSIVEFTTDCVLYSKLRPYLNKVVIPDENGFCTSELVTLKCGDEVKREYIAYSLRHKSFIEYINSKTAGAKMPRASMDVLRNFKMPKPPIDRQIEFSQLVTQIDKLKFINKR